MRRQQRGWLNGQSRFRRMEAPRSRTASEPGWEAEAAAGKKTGPADAAAPFSLLRGGFRLDQLIETLIFLGWTASRLGMTISSTPWSERAVMASGLAVSGKLKRLWNVP